MKLLLLKLMKLTNCLKNTPMTLKLLKKPLKKALLLPKKLKNSMKYMKPKNLLLKKKMLKS